MWPEGMHQVENGRGPGTGTFAPGHATGRGWNLRVTGHGRPAWLGHVFSASTSRSPRQGSEEGSPIRGMVWAVSVTIAIAFLVAFLIWVAFGVVNASAA